VLTDANAAHYMYFGLQLNTPPLLFRDVGDTIITSLISVILQHHALGALLFLHRYLPPLESCNVHALEKGLGGTTGERRPAPTHGLRRHIGYSAAERCHIRKGFVARLVFQV
jgi:hypothetical protein